MLTTEIAKSLEMIMTETFAFFAVPIAIMILFRIVVKTLNDFDKDANSK